MLLVCWRLFRLNSVFCTLDQGLQLNAAILLDLLKITLSFHLLSSNPRSLCHLTQMSQMEDVFTILLQQIRAADS